jgi:folate-binding protein YgfZ
VTDPTHPSHPRSAVSFGRHSTQTDGRTEGERDRAEQLVLRGGVGWVPVEREFVVASGPDAVDFLHGQLSQDIAALAVGDSAWSFVLEPQGKVDALVRVTRLADTDLVLDVDGGQGEALIARLARFKLRTKCDLDPVPWSCLAVRGAGADAVPTPPGAHPLPAPWPGLPGIDLIAESAIALDGVEQCGPDALHALRVESGWPAMGAELRAGETIPAEAGQWLVDLAVSFTKGCFTGQELVARIDSRGGNVPRRLQGLVLEGEAVPEPGAEVRDPDGAVGVVTSAAWSAALDAPVALAYLARRVTVPAAVTVGLVAARAVPLPLVS